MEMDKIWNGPYRPAYKGMIEQFHQTLNSMLAIIVIDNQREWKGHVPCVMVAYRACVHEATGYSSNYLTLGREVCGPFNAI